MRATATTSTHGILGGAERDGWFTLTRQTPSADLADYVERHWIVRWDLPSGESFTQKLLPHPCVNLVCESGRVAIYGTPLAQSQHRLEASGIAVGTKFRPGALTPFVDVPARALVNRAYTLPTLFGDGGAQLEQQLIASREDPDAHIEMVERFFRERVPPPDRRLSLLRSVVADMLVSERSVGVAGFARRHALSESTLQRLFRDYIGLPPKWVLKRYRVHEAAERLASGESRDTARLAAELGYFDQSHFTGEFSAQVGCSPVAYARACATARAGDRPHRSAA